MWSCGSARPARAGEGDVRPAGARRGRAEAARRLRLPGRAPSPAPGRAPSPCPGSQQLLQENWEFWHSTARPRPAALRSGWVWGGQEPWPVVMGCKGSVCSRVFRLLLGASPLPDGLGRFVPVAAASRCPSGKHRAAANAGEEPPEPVRPHPLPSSLSRCHPGMPGLVCRSRDEGRQFPTSHMEHPQCGVGRC